MCVNCFTGNEALIINAAGAVGIARTTVSKYIFRNSSVRKAKREIKIYYANEKFANDLGLKPELLFGDAPKVEVQETENKIILTGNIFNKIKQLFALVKYA